MSPWDHGARKSAPSFVIHRPPENPAPTTRIDASSGNTCRDIGAWSLPRRRPDGRRSAPSVRRRWRAEAGWLGVSFNEEYYFSESEVFGVGLDVLARATLAIGDERTFAELGRRSGGLETVGFATSFSELRESSTKGKPLEDAVRRLCEMHRDDLQISALTEVASLRTDERRYERDRGVLRAYWSRSNPLIRGISRLLASASGCAAFAAEPRCPRALG